MSSTRASNLFCGPRFGLEDGHMQTLEEIGRELQLTRERVRQIEAQALCKVRNSAYVPQLASFLDYYRISVAPWCAGWVREIAMETFSRSGGREHGHRLLPGCCTAPMRRLVARRQRSLTSSPNAAAASPSTAIWTSCISG